VIARFEQNFIELLPEAWFEQEDEEAFKGEWRLVTEEDLVLAAFWRLVWQASREGWQCKETMLLCWRDEDVGPWCIRIETMFDPITDVPADITGWALRRTDEAGVFRWKARTVFIVGWKETNTKAVVPQQPHAHTAFPVLGGEETCDCWMIQEAQMKSPANWWARFLIADKYMRSSLIPFFHAELDGWLFKKPASGLNYVLHPTPHQQECFVETWSVSTLSYCHLGLDPSFKAGHSFSEVLRLEATAVGELIFYHIAGDIPSYFYQNLELTKASPLCKCTSIRKPMSTRLQAQLEHKLTFSDKTWLRRTDRAKNLDYYTQPRNVVPTGTKMLSGVRRRGDGLTEEEEAIYQVLEAQFEGRVREYYRLIGSRSYSKEFDERVEEYRSEFLRRSWVKGDERVVRFMDLEIPNWMKARNRQITRGLETLARREFKISIKNPKGFEEATTYQEWLELETRRYEDALAMSRSERVRALPQLAREYLKGAQAKHQIANIVRVSVQDPGEGERLLSVFNARFVKFFQGEVLPLAEDTLAKIQRERTRYLEMKAKNLSAIDERNWMEAQNLSKLSTKAREKREQKLVRREVAEAGGSLADQERAVAAYVAKSLRTNIEV